MNITQQTWPLAPLRGHSRPQKRPLGSAICNMCQILIYIKNMSIMDIFFKRLFAIIVGGNDLRCPIFFSRSELPFRKGSYFFLNPFPRCLSFKILRRCCHIVFISCAPNGNNFFSKAASCFSVIGKVTRCQ